MPTKRFYISEAPGGDMPRYPVTSSYLDILRNLTNSNYVFIDRGSSMTYTFGEISLRFSSSEIRAAIGENSVIQSCSFSMYASTWDSSAFYVHYMTLYSSKSKQLLSGGTDNIGLWRIWNSSNHTTNPDTNAPWKLSDFDSYMKLTISTNGGDGARIAYLYMDVTYTEVLPIGMSKIRTPKGILELPIFGLDKVGYPALKIATPKGIGAFLLVNPSDENASTIRIATPKGIKAIAYMK